MRLLIRCSSLILSTVNNLSHPARMSAQPVRKYLKIYTRTGDGGTSVTFTGERLPKDADIFNALGTTDELSSTIGLACEYCQDAGHDIVDKLGEVQCMLQDVGSSIATPLSSARIVHTKRTEFSKEYVGMLEMWIDHMTEQLPPLRHFILPSGGKSATSLHLARSICRRAERSVTPMVRNDDLDEETLKFLNRLSDFLFTAARYTAMKEGRKEKVYKRADSKHKEQEHDHDK